MKEIDTLRRQLRERTKALTKLEEKIGVERLAFENGGSGRELRLLEQDREDERVRLEGIQRRLGVLEAQEAHENNRSRIVALGHESTALKVDYDADLVETAERWAADAVRLASKLRPIWDRQTEAFGVIRSDIGYDLRNADTPEARKAVAELEADLLQRGADLSVLLVRWPHSQRGHVMDQPYHLPPLTWVGELLLRAVDAAEYRRAESQGQPDREKCETAYQAALGGAA